jgi:Restriction endonuclease
MIRMEELHSKGLMCVKERADASPFESGQTTLLVQVKKHQGMTNEHAVKQLPEMLKAHPAADACVMSLADGFTVEATALADTHGVVLMDGETIASLLLAELSQVSPLQ